MIVQPGLSGADLEGGVPAGKFNFKIFIVKLRTPRCRGLRWQTHISLRPTSRIKFLDPRMALDGT